MNLHLGGLDTIILQSNQRRSQKSSPFLLCLFHGYGASAENLIPLVEQLHVPETVNIVLPNAPLARFPDTSISTFAWWHIDFDSLIQRRFFALKDDGLDAFYDEMPHGLPSARKTVLTWLEAVRHHCDTPPWSNLILGGFSQGAMLAADIALHLQVAIAGLCLFSGSLINRPEWTIQRNSAPTIPRFQSHGFEDPILPFAMGKALHEFLEQGSIQGEFFPFNGGHEIPDEVITRCKTHIIRWVATF